MNPHIVMLQYCGRAADKKRTNRPWRIAGSIDEKHRLQSASFVTLEKPMAIHKNMKKRHALGKEKVLPIPSGNSHSGHLQQNPLDAATGEEQWDSDNLIMSFLGSRLIGSLVPMVINNFDTLMFSLALVSMWMIPFSSA
jgi:hypothetical protein